MISLKQINRERVKAIPIPNEDKRAIKGYDICEEVYANIFLCAKKKSGKTSALFKIMKKCCIKSTVIYVFCSTVYKDVNWIEIRKHFKNKGMEINVFTSIYEDGENQLQNLVRKLNDEAKGQEENNDNEDEEQEEEIDKCDQILKLLRYNHDVATGKIKPEPEPEQEETNESRPRKSKFKAPEYMIIFDDLSGELKEPALIELLKKNRHYKTKIIISSQWVHDLKPESRKQIDLMMIFKGFPVKKLEEIYKDCDSSVPFETFIEIYKKATEKQHSFMYIDTRSDSFRCCFDKQFIIE